MRKTLFPSLRAKRSNPENGYHWLTSFARNNGYKNLTNQGRDIVDREKTVHSLRVNINPCQHQYTANKPNNIGENEHFTFDHDAIDSPTN